jgi:Ca2+/H+ antiporter
MKSRSVDGRKTGFMDETGWTSSSLPHFAPVVVHVMHGTVAAAVAAAVACLERCVAVLPRSLLGASKFHEADLKTTVPNLLLSFATQNISLQFLFPDLQVHREAFAQEETDGERERERTHTHTHTHTHKKWQVSGSLRVWGSRRWEWWKNGAGSRM